MTIQLQLDYFMSAQFAGVAVALKSGLYAQAKLDVSILPECPPGQEPQFVLAAQAASPNALCVGTIEQNVLAPFAAEHGGVNASKVTAVGAMFGRSPLCLAALPDPLGATTTIAATTGKKLTVGAHEDTVELIQRLLPEATVLTVPREAKLSMLKDGTLDAVQVYDCMETLTLQRELDKASTEGSKGGALRVAAFEELGTAATTTGMTSSSSEISLGYAQVVFATSEALADPSKAADMVRFMEATFEGWRVAIRDPQAAVDAVLSLQPTGVDHFESTAEFVTEAVKRCCSYVKRTSAGGMLGVIDPGRWEVANKWLLPCSSSSEDNSATFPVLNETLWAPDARLMLGCRLASSMLQETKKLSLAASLKLGRNPRLCVINLGDEPLGGAHADAKRRFELFGLEGASWFDKISSGAAVGIDVEELAFSKDVTTEQLAAALQSVCERVDGVQLLWPLPPQVDALTVYSTIPVGVDVDGAHWLSQMELAGGQRAVTNGSRELLHNAPVTAAAVIHLLDHYGEGIAGKRVFVVGRSKLCGSPLAFMFAARGGLVTTAHSQTSPEQLKAACLEADIVVPCVGKPGLIRGDWLKPGAVVINVGTTFVEAADGENELGFGGGQLLPDIPASLQDMGHVKLVASCPNGVGPLSAAVLLQQTAVSALGRTLKPVGATADTPVLPEDQCAQWVTANPPWQRAPRVLSNGDNGAEIPSLKRAYNFPTYPSAATFVAAVAAAAEVANHHPNISIVHSCTEGADVAVELFTYSVKAITSFDTAAAAMLDQIYVNHTTMPSTDA